MDHTLGFYENDLYSKLDFPTVEEDLFPDGFGGLNGVEDSIDLSAFLTQSQNEPINTVRQESFPTLGNIDNLFCSAAQQQNTQNTYQTTILPSIVKKEPVDISYKECETTTVTPVESPNQTDMPQQNFFNHLQQPSPGLTGNDAQSPYASQVNSPTSTTTFNFKSTPASKTLSKSSTTKRQRQVPEKGTTEYLTKRQKNNVAVRKSREKSKRKAVQLQEKVKELTDENERLNKKVELLTKELSVLKQLFTNVGKTVPQQLQNC